MAVQKLLKLVKIWQSCSQMYTATFYEPPQRCRFWFFQVRCTQKAGDVINFITVACRISSRLKWYKVYKNRLTLAKVSRKLNVTFFMVHCVQTWQRDEPSYHISHYQQQQTWHKTSHGFKDIQSLTLKNGYSSKYILHHTCIRRKTLLKSPVIQQIYITCITDSRTLLMSDYGVSALFHWLLPYSQTGPYHCKFTQVLKLPSEVLPVNALTTWNSRPLALRALELSQSDLYMPWTPTCSWPPGTIETPTPNINTSTYFPT